MSVHVGSSDDPPVTTARDLHQLLDQVENEIQEPTLFQLTGASATMHIGVGNPHHHSVALFLDDEGQAWASHGNEEDLNDIAFLEGDRRYEFYGTTAIPPDDARMAAKEFITTNRKPTNIDWKPEST